MGAQLIEEVNWGEFGIRKGNGPGYLLFKGEKVYELRTDIDRDCRKLLRRLKVSRKTAKNLMPLVWNLYSFGLPLKHPYEGVIRQLQRIMEETSEATSDNRIDELASCLKAARKLRRKFVPKEPITQLCDWDLGLEVIRDGDGELNAILDCSDAQRGLKEALLHGLNPIEGVLDGKFEGEFVLYNVVRATDSPIALLAQKLWRVPTKKEVATVVFKAAKDQAYLAHYFRAQGFQWLPTEKPGRPARKWVK